MSTISRTDLRIAALQTDLAWENPTSNTARIEGHLAQLDGSVDVIVLPEMWATGFTMDPETHGSALAHDWMENEAGWPAPLVAMRSWASTHNAAVVGSLSCRVEGDEAAVNRCFFVPPVGTVAHYDKRHLFSFAGEPAAYAPGIGRTVVQWRGWNILLQVCYDLRFPVFSRNAQDEPYDVAIYVANWPEVRVAAWSALLRARAIENQCYVVGVNRVGEDGNGIPHSGASALIDPYGETAMELGPHSEGWLYGEASPTELERYRQKFPVLSDADGFTLN